MSYRAYLLLIEYTLFCIFTVHAQDGPREQFGSISGIVTSQTTGEGLRKAYLRLVEADNHNGNTYAAVSDDRGAFVIDKIAPGKYYFYGERIGFIDAEYGAGVANNSAVILRVASGDKISGIEIKMVPHAVVMGSVLDPDGDPWRHANIRILRSVWRNGHRKIEDAETTTSSSVDDRGEFRIAGLKPGRYYLLAEPEAYFEKQLHPDVTGQSALQRQPTWFPSSLDMNSAIPITVSAGQQLTGVDIRLRSGFGSMLSIRGKASGLSDILRQRDFVQIWVRKQPTTDQIGSVSGTIRRDGSFEITNVSSGTYELSILRGFPGRTVLGRTTVQVNDANVDEVSIELHVPQILHANVRFEGNETVRDVPLRLESLDLQTTMAWSQKSANVGLDFYDVGLGRYQIYDTLPVGSPVFLKTVRYGNAETKDGTFTLSSYGVPLDLVLSTRGAKLSGTITAANTDAAKDKTTAPRVVLIPDALDASLREYRTRFGAFDQSGTFTIEGIAPGKYKLYAFESVPEDIWLADEFLKEVEGIGVPYEAAEGSTDALQPPLLRKAEADRILARLGLD